MKIPYLEPKTFEKMTKKLYRGQRLILDQDQYDLSRITIGLGWDVRQREERSGLFDRILGKTEKQAYDLDVVAFLLDENEKVANLGHNKKAENGRVLPLVGSDVIHFNNLQLPDGSVVHTGDNPSGEGAGDDEQIIVKLLRLPERYDKILFLASIYQGIERNQHFGMIDNAYIRAIDARGQEIVRYPLSDEPEYNQKRSMVFAEVYRKGDKWAFYAIGEAHKSDSFIDLLRDYIYLD